MKENDIKNWNESGLSLKQNLIGYNWQYRKKICVNCDEHKRKKLDCMVFDSFKDGIQETHCRNLIQARTNKFKDEIESIIESHPLAQSINNVAEPISVSNKIPKKTLF